MSETPAQRQVLGGPRAAFAILPLALACLYVLVPGHPGAPLHGVPIGLPGAAVLTVLVGAMWWFRGVRLSTSQSRVPLALLVLAMLGKALVAAAAPQAGWIARYYTNERFTGAYEPSTEFPRLGATRVDRVVDFDGASLPAHFLNHLRLEQPSGRSQLVAEQPLSVAWTGFLSLKAPQTVSVGLTARGSAWMVVDGVEQARVTSPAAVSTTQAALPLTTGIHRIDVAYVKAANMNGRIGIAGLDGIAPNEASAAARSNPALWIAFAWLCHVVAGIAVALQAVTLWRSGARLESDAGTRLERRLAAAVGLLFAAQGIVFGAVHIGRVWDLTTGDDWFGFEARARDVLVNGPLMTLGAEVGRGQPFFFYPLYSYFAAAVHWLVGEDGSGIVFAQFLVLAATTVVVFRLGRELFGPRVALGSALLLVMIEELAFTRYYTITMLADNLYILPVALSVLSLTRVARTDRRAPLVWSGVWVGIAALTKPGMLAFFALSVPFVLYVRRDIMRAALYVAVALGVIGIATVRNLVVSGQPVLITQGQGPTFIHYSLAPDLVEKGGYTKAPPLGLADNVSRVLQIAAEHPLDYVRWNSRKVVFSLGVVNLQSGYRPHPELLLTTLGWIAAVLLVPAARAREAWPAHLFALSHLATMVLTLPWVYGYRLILPTFVIIPVFAAAAFDAIWARLNLLRVSTPSAAR